MSASAESMPAIHNESGMVTISTSRLVIRGAKTGDTSALHSAFQDPEVMRYWSSLPHTTEAETEAWVARMIKSPQNGVTDFVICLKPGLKPIGKIGVWQAQEIGFLLARAYWGKGFAHEALQSVIPYFFEHKHMNEITADTDPRNTASIGLLQKMGFEITAFKEKTWEIGGEWMDSIYLKLTREKWEKLVITG